MSKFLKSENLLQTGIPGLTTTQIKHCAGHRPLQFLYQSTHRHPFITGGVFPEWSHKYLYGKTSNLYTSRVNRTSAIILLAVGFPACTSLTRELWVRVLLTLTLRPHHGRLPTQRNLPVQNFILASLCRIMLSKLENKCGELP